MIFTSIFAHRESFRAGNSIKLEKSLEESCLSEKSPFSNSASSVSADIASPGFRELSPGFYERQTHTHTHIYKGSPSCIFAESREITPSECATLKKPTKPGRGRDHPIPSFQGGRERQCRRGERAGERTDFRGRLFTFTATGEKNYRVS